MSKFLIPFLFFAGVLIASMYTIPQQASATYTINENVFPDQLKTNKEVFMCQSTFAFTSAVIGLFSKFLSFID